MSKGEDSETIEGLRLGPKKSASKPVIMDRSGRGLVTCSFAFLSVLLAESVLLSGGSRFRSGDEVGHSAEGIDPSEKELLLSFSSVCDVDCEDRSCLKLPHFAIDCGDSSDESACCSARLINSCKTEIGTFAVGALCPGSGGHQAILDD